MEASLTALTDEVVKSSAIEGQNLNPEEGRSSIARKLGLDVAGLPKPGQEVEGVVDMMLDATRNFDAKLTAERLFGWHAALFPTGRSGMTRITVGAWRTTAKLAKCSNDTGLRDIRELLDRGIIVKNPGTGRSTSYRLADPDQVPV